MKCLDYELLEAENLIEIHSLEMFHWLSKEEKYAINIINHDFNLDKQFHHYNCE